MRVPVNRERSCLLTLTPDYPPSVGGIQILLERLVAHLPAWDHIIVARGPSASAPESVVRTRSLRGPVSLAELNARAFLTGMIHRPHVVLSGHVVATPAAVAIGKAIEVPVVTYLYADEVPARRKLSRMAVKQSAACIAVSEYTRTLAIAAGAQADRVRVVPPAVDQLPATMSNEQPSDRPTLITVARLTDRYKGHDVVLEAMPTVLQAVPDARWVIIGSGPLAAELEARARELGLSAATVVFLGQLSNAERDRELARAHVFVMPSRLPSGGAGGEGFGIAYYEAALHGVPSVAGAAAGAIDAVTHQETGLLVDPADPQAVAGALVALLGDPAQRGRLGAAARRRAEAATWARMASDVDHILRQAMTAQRR